MLVVHILQMLVFLDLAEKSHERESSVNGNIASLILRYETKYCESRCIATSGTDTMSPFPADDRVCTRCSCDPECRDFGDCCPDLYIGKGKYDLECVKLFQGYSEEIYVVTQCPLGEKLYSEELSRKCNANNILLVSTATENLIFKNRFCAQCHGYEDFQTWNIGVACEEFPEQISAFSDPLVILKSLETSAMCITEYRVPRKVLTRKCHKTSPISECNVTGTWEMYSADIEAACHAYSHVTKSGYQNIFCQLCNEGEISETPSFRLPKIGLQKIKPVIGLLQFEDSVMNAATSSNYCPGGEYHDTTDQCRKILCPPFQQLKSGECLNIFTQFPVQRLRYFIDIYLVPVIENSIEIVNITQLKRVIRDYYISQTDVKTTTIMKVVLKLHIKKSHYFGKHCSDNMAGFSIADISGMEIRIYVATRLSKEHPFASFADRVSYMLFGEVRLLFDGLNVSFRGVYKHTLPGTHHQGYHTLSAFIYEPATIEEEAFEAFSSNNVKRDCPQILYHHYDYILMADASVLLKNSNTLIAREDFTPTSGSDILVCLSILEDLKLLMNDVGVSTPTRTSSSSTNIPASSASTHTPASRVRCQHAYSHFFLKHQDTCLFR
ncbi:uncharacterized protein [Haliotis asinina]|uniref:uncharacterized protein n=1 Tax=Haliotis asinina TaxID=109174 RepID=UPI003531DD46